MMFGPQYKHGIVLRRGESSQCPRCSRWVLVRERADGSLRLKTHSIDQSGPAAQCKTMVKAGECCYETRRTHCGEPGTLEAPDRRLWCRAHAPKDV